MAWLSVSRAIRTPGRLEADYEFLLTPSFGVPVFPVVTGTPGIEAEQLMAYEAGIRIQPKEFFSWDLSTFYNDYNGLIETFTDAGGAFVVGPNTFVPIRFNNSVDSMGYGFESVVNCDMTDNWSIQGSYSFLRTGPQNEGSTSPRNQANIWSSWDLGRDWRADLIWRYVDRLPEDEIDSYNAMDVRLEWTPLEFWEFALVGRHLLDAGHLEFDDGTFSTETEVQREVYGIVTLRY